MARISKYTFDENVTEDDFVIGSDGRTKKTRNFRLEDLTNFFAKQQEILGNKFSYKYNQTGSVDTLSVGEISFNNRTITQTPFSGITTVYINRYNINNEDVYAYVTELQDKGGVINIYNGNLTTSFAAFRIQAINLNQNDVIQLNVDLLASSGTITGNDLAIVVGEFNTGDKSYIHTQIAASTTWSVTHALNKYPSVSVVDDGNNVVIGDIQYTNANQLTITFNGAISGKAYIN